MQPKSLDIVGYSSVCISRITLTEVQCPSLIPSGVDQV
jgi:hypothetical protein